MRFAFFNDTGRLVRVHGGTFVHGCKGDAGPIKPLETRVFELPENTYPWVKMWDYGESGLHLLVSPTELPARVDENGQR